MPRDTAVRRFGQVEITVEVEPLMGEHPSRWANAIEIAEAAIQMVKDKYKEDTASEGVRK